MTQLLHLQCSITGDHSVTRKLSDELVAEWVRTHPSTQVEVLDLAADPLPHFGGDNVAAMMTPPAQHSDAMKAASALSDRLITQLERANILVIGCPMYNFTIASQLKAWFDHVTIVGRTFKYSAPGVGKGLLFGKKTFVVEARGGDYSEAPVSSWDFQEPLVRTLLAFIGLYDTQFIRAEGLRQKEEERPFIINSAQEKIRRVAA